MVYKDAVSQAESGNEDECAKAIEVLLSYHLLNILQYFSIAAGHIYEMAKARTAVIKPYIKML